MRPSADVPSPPRPLRPGGSAALREVLKLWALAFGAIALTRAIGPVSQYAKAVAAVGFLYLPGLVVWKRDEDYRDYGATMRGWPRGFAWGLGVSAVVLPLFAGGFVAFTHLLPHFPDWLRGIIAPYTSNAHFAPRLPDQFWKHVIDQFFVVALPEEFFYRGYMQARLRDWKPGGRRFLGAALGPAFWLTQALFAVGHLAEFYPWRLAVFFPAIVFGLLRERTNTIVAGTIFHALSNLTIMVLEASFFAGP